jgi:hypothetical protein
MPTSRTRIGSRLSPRRLDYAERLLQFIVWHGSKFIFDQRGYQHTSAELMLHRFAVDQGLDDLFALGVVDEKFYGDKRIVTALARSLEAA